MNPLAYGIEERGRPRLLGVQLHLHRRQDARPLLLPVRRQHAAGDRAGRGRRASRRRAIHYARMVWLLVFGLLHFYFIWFGDILAGYALIGMIAYLFRRTGADGAGPLGRRIADRPDRLFGVLVAGSFVLAAQVAAAARCARAELVAEWRAMSRDASRRRRRPGAGRRSWPLLPRRLWRPRRAPADRAGCRAVHRHPASSAAETLAYMLLGMALLKTGFLTRRMGRRRYRRVALIGFGIGVPAYAVLACLLAPRRLRPCSMHRLSRWPRPCRSGR